MITIIDYGAGNLFSVQNALNFLGVENNISSKVEDIISADKLILPGVGAFPDAMKMLDEAGLTEVIKEQAKKKELMGICLGMQMLFDESDEFGLHKGLGLIPGRVEKIPALDTDGDPQRVPHISWNGLWPAGGRTDFAGTALASVTPGQECYFVHSYEAKPTNEADRLADTRYGGRAVCAAAAHGSVLGCQFHPEKSGPVGLGILEGFLAGCP